MDGDRGMLHNLNIQTFQNPTDQVLPAGTTRYWAPTIHHKMAKGLVYYTGYKFAQVHPPWTLFLGVSYVLLHQNHYRSRLHPITLGLNLLYNVQNEYQQGTQGQCISLSNWWRGKCPSIGRIGPYGSGCQTEMERDITGHARYGDSWTTSSATRKGVILVHLEHIWSSLFSAAVRWLTQCRKRNFRFLSILGFGSTLICTWEVLLGWASCASIICTCLDWCVTQKYYIHRHQWRKGRFVLGISRVYVWHGIGLHEYGWNGIYVWILSLIHLPRNTVALLPADCGLGPQPLGVNTTGCQSLHHLGIKSSWAT